MLRELIFDLDGVVTNSAVSHFRAWRALAQSIGITLSPEVNNNLKGLSRADSLNYILALAGQKDRFTAIEKKRLTTEKNRPRIVKSSATYLTYP